MGAGERFFCPKYQLVGNGVKPCIALLSSLCLPLQSSFVIHGLSFVDISLIVQNACKIPGWLANQPMLFPISISASNWFFCGVNKVHS